MRATWVVKTGGNKKNEAGKDAEIPSLFQLCPERGRENFKGPIILLIIGPNIPKSNIYSKDSAANF